MDRFSNKQPAEAYYVVFDFTNVTGTATIASASVKAKIVATGVDVTATITTVASQSIAGKKVYVWVKAGTDGVDYQITCTGTASDGSIYEMEGLILVAEVPRTEEAAGAGPGCVVRPTAEPVSLAEVKHHLRVEIGEDNDYIKACLDAAIAQVENFTGRQIMTATWDIRMNEFPDRNYIELPYGNLQSVTHVKYKDSAGIETTMIAVTDYIVETNGEGVGRIVLPDGKSWPSFTPFPSNPISIRFVCGYASAKVPSAIKAAIQLIVADMYSYRGEMVPGNYVRNTEAVNSLLYPYKLWRF